MKFQSGSLADCNRVDVDVVDPAKVDRRSPANLDAIGSCCRLREHDEAGRGFIGPDRKDILSQAPPSTLMSIVHVEASSFEAANDNVM